jgi:pimeloyl-ACP methyl ester carboxylesterase
MGSSKNPLVILHGLFGSHRNWQTISKTLAERLGRLVISADLRNHGQSVQFNKGQPVGQEMTWPLMVEDASELMRDINRPVVLLGHSLGGQLVMQSLFREPKAIQQAIVLDVAPRPYNFRHSVQNSYIETMQRVEGLSRSQAVTEFRKMENNEMIVQFLFTNWRDGQFQIPLQTLKDGMTVLGQTFEEWGGPVTTPTLFIRGGRSDYMTAPFVEVKRHFTDYSIETLPDSGHWLHYDNPHEFMRIITTKLDQAP